MKILIGSIIYLLLSVGLIATSSADIKRESWDFIVFTQQWPSTVCYEWKDKSVKNECNFPMGLDSWTIHGVWPSESSGASPQFCNSSWIFNATKIEELMTNLTNHWPNIYAATSQDEFWAHEWNKHGTCAAYDILILNELGYFTAGLDMANNYNITMSLAVAGIVPDASKSYSVDQFHSAAITHFGVAPVITCYKEKKKGKYLVKEIRLCVDRNLKVINCEGEEEDSCPKGGNVYYLPMEIFTQDVHNPGASNKWEL